MSDFKFLCPECGQKILCDTALTGTQIACPACQKAITIPSAPAAAPMAPVMSTAAPAPVAAGAAAVAAPPPRPAPPPVPLTPPRPAGAAKAPGAEKTHYSALAIASLLCSVFIPLGFIPSLICGHMAKQRLRQNVFLAGETMANAGLAISYCVLSLLLLSGIAFLGAQWHFHPVRTIRVSLDAAPAPDYRIVDQIIIDENEDDHGLSGQMYGLTGGKSKGRRATKGGSFSYTMKVLPNLPMSLNCRYSGDEAKGRIFDIAVDDQIIATQTLNHDLPGKIFDEEYKIPASLTRGKNEVTVEFQARPNMIAGTLYGCQILKR
jgi:hypothetical protein